LPEETAWRYAPDTSGSAFAGTIVDRLRLPLHRHAVVRRITNLLYRSLATKQRLETFALSSLRLFLLRQPLELIEPAVYED
jgi:hypothetical protein